ncbi:MAG: hypothetical protein JWL64_1283 [Frankiales bacterium]|nr:hypothetical protein [Frankiales bacterium]
MSGEVLARADGVLDQELDGQVLLLPPGSSEVLLLNEVASALWQLLDPVADLESAVATLATHYGVAAEQVRADVQPVIDLLVAQGAATLSARRA